jgi:uncharacterized membrane protein YidH (DUF202 family)
MFCGGPNQYLATNMLILVALQLLLRGFERCNQHQHQRQHQHIAYGHVAYMYICDVLVLVLVLLLIYSAFLRVTALCA